MSDIRAAMGSDSSNMEGEKRPAKWSHVKEILSSEAHVIRGHWSDILMRSKACVGILRRLELITCVGDIYEVLRCLTVLIGSGSGIKIPSQLPQSSRCDWRSFSFVEDYRTSCLAIYESVFRIIERLEGTESAPVYSCLVHFVKVYPWNSQLINRDQEFSKRLFNLLLSSKPISSGILSSLAELYRCVPKESIVQAHLEEFASACEQNNSSTRLNQLQSFNYLLRKVSSRDQPTTPLIASLIEECITLYEHSREPEAGACLENMALLDEISPEVEEKIHHLISTNTATESLLFGLGKASRRNSKNLATVYRILVPQIDQLTQETMATAALTQCIGDVLFSDVLQTAGVQAGSQYLLEILSKKIHRRTEASCALRTFMTGYARMIEAGTISNRELLREIDIFFRRFVETRIVSVTGDPQMNERFVADLFRSVGLIDSMQSQSEAGWTCEKAISKALEVGLLSGKTQIVLGCLSSLGVRVPLHEPIIESILEDCLSSLENRLSWDFRSASEISGTLHVILESCRTMPGISGSIQKRIFQVISRVAESRVEQYNSAIQKHREEIVTLLTSKSKLTHRIHQ